MKQNESKGYGIASFILGLCSVCMWLIGLPLGIVGICMAAKQENIQSTGLSKAGLVLSIIGTVFGMFWAIVYLVYFITLI